MANHLLFPIGETRHLRLNPSARSRWRRLVFFVGFILSAPPTRAESEDKNRPATAGAKEEPNNQESQGKLRDETELDAIYVEGELLAPPAHITSSSSALDEEDLEVFEDNDVHQVLLRVPGVQVRGEDGVGLRPNIGIRGTNPERSAKVTLMEDGILFGPAPYSAPAAYYFPLVGRMQTVKVYKGGAQLRFGPNAMGGAIDFETVPVPRNGWLAEGDLAYGQYGLLKGHARAGYGTETVGALLELAHLDSNGFKELDTGGPTGFDKNEFMAKLRWNTPRTAD
ncbi:MAG: TonB-dependent receptor plug domain-containing protein, partial [Polyangiaceae bacterium]|nr:TonB-dependent receptor plug domain-containing protein [Polyangiaceae bacterium]